jgi:NADH-quinone oxidoreductase subunit E
VTTTPDILGILEQYEGGGRDRLIPLLQDVQERCGYISKEAVGLIGERLDLPPSKVYGVATFYNQFRFKPLGRYLIQVCRGTACHVKGSAKLLDALTNALRIEPGDTTRDGVFSLEVVACIGACGLAPVITVGGEFHAKVTPDKIDGILDEYRKRAESDD